MVLLTREDYINFIHNETLIPKEELEEMTNSELQDWVLTINS